MLLRGITAAIATLAWTGGAHAVDRIVLEAGEIVTARARLESARLELDLTTSAPSTNVSIARISLGGGQRLERVTLACGRVVIREPRFACLEGRVSASGGPTGRLAFSTAAEYDSASGTASVDGRGQQIAGGALNFSGELRPAGMSMAVSATALRIPAMRELVAPWLALPAALSLDGEVSAKLQASGRPGSLRGTLKLTADEVDLSNEAGTVVAEKVALELNAAVRQAGDGLEIESKIASAAGQALAGPVLLDFEANPLTLTAHGHASAGTVELREVVISQRDLLTGKARASLRLAGSPFVENARLELTEVLFPAAYTSFVQIALAATDFGALEAAGTASGSVEIADDRVVRASTRIEDLDLHDDRTQFVMSDLRGELHWAPADGVAMPDSTLAWSRMRAYGLSGGTARLDFKARGTSFELVREARVPVFDGALVVHALAARDVGGPAAELTFDADIEPISMALISRAFDWPELSGVLAGNIPGLTYRDGVLALNGDLTASVFGGAITGRNLRLRDPLGPWPRFTADVRARKLDLELVTSTFSIGSITGRLDADLAGLELFNWSPVAFDARLQSTPGDRSPRLISQKAVTSISSIGGGSGGVTKALQSGVLRFFERFRYDRIGISCRLRNEVCLMSGVEPHGAGYYIVKGRGLPRIDIIGNAGRVDWPQLVSQIVTGMRSEDVIVR
jgi:hypothetical protein